MRGLGPLLVLVPPHLKRGGGEGEAAARVEEGHVIKVPKRERGTLAGTSHLFLIPSYSCFFCVPHLSGVCSPNSKAEGQRICFKGQKRQKPLHFPSLTPRCYPISERHPVLTPLCSHCGGPWASMTFQAQLAPASHVQEKKTEPQEDEVTELGL